MIFSMASVIRRYIVGSIYYGIGLALAYLAIFGVLLQAIMKGRKGIVGLFKRGKHDIEPESKSDLNCFLYKFLVLSEV